VERRAFRFLPGSVPLGANAYPHGLHPELPLIEIVWWVTKELTWHAAEIWFMRDLYAATHGRANEADPTL
jgi:hypothetical protein